MSDQLEWQDAICEPYQLRDVVPDGLPTVGLVLFADVDFLDLVAIQRRRQEWLELFP
jgi:hypothetical protein